MKSMERELEIGREIQMGFLPLNLPTLEGWEIASYFKAAHEVAGDYYDAFKLPDGNLACVVGDVCGKGVGAALYMSLFRTLIRVTSKTDYFYAPTESRGTSDAERLKHVIGFTNNYVAETHGHTSMFSTVFISIVNVKENKLTYINCGNEPALFVRSDGDISLLWPTGPIVGIIPNADFQTGELALNENDLLLVYTDGVTDALDSQEVAFSRQRLVDIVNADRSHCAGLLSNLQLALDEYIGNASQFDDITVLAIMRQASI